MCDHLGNNFILGYNNNTQVYIFWELYKKINALEYELL